jgi:hypothetical protein
VVAVQCRHDGGGVKIGDVRRQGTATESR